MPKPLNPKQMKFVERYLATGNATQSYIDAYKCSRAAAEASAARLLLHAGVKAALAEARNKAAEALELSAEWTIQKMMAEAQDRGPGSTHSARVRALELLGRNFGLFPSSHQHTGPKGKPISVNLTGLSDDALDTLDRILGAAEEPDDHDAETTGRLREIPEGSQAQDTRSTS
jgi:hypothetical protein